LLFDAVAYLGPALLALGVVAFVANHRASKVGALPVFWHRLRRWRWLLTLLLAVGAVFCVYPVTGRAGAHYRVWGFPFMAAAFDSRGLDYVSPLSPLLIGLDVLTWALLPDLFLWCWRVYASRRRDSTGDSRRGP
jgi:hypothetical protein